MNVGVSKKGFTIVELLIVIVVIAILAAITIVAYTGVQNRAKASSLQNTVSQIAKKVESVKIASTTETYPDSLSTANITAPATVAYSVSPSGKAFCVVGKDGTLSYYSTQSQLQPVAGSCTTVDGLVGWWRMNGDATDSSGSGNNGSTTNQALVTGEDGQSNGAFSFNGNGAITTGSAQLPLGSSPRTVLAWVNATAYPSSGWGMVHAYGGAGSALASASALSINTAGRIAFNSQSNDYVSPTVLPLNSWHLIGYTLNGTQISIIYDDAALQTSTLSTMPATNVNPNAYIGAWVGAASNRWQGVIDDLRVYNRVLSTSEIQALYTAGAL